MRTAACIALPAGAVASLGCMMFVGRHNPSRLLLLLFTLWVLAPYLLLLWANVTRQRWAVPVTLLVTLCSLIPYAYAALGPPISKPARVFLAVPALACLLIAATAAMAFRRSY